MTDSESDSEDEMSQEANDGSKWVKTDSDCKFFLVCLSPFNFCMTDFNELFYDRLIITS